VIFLGEKLLFPELNAQNLAALGGLNRVVVFEQGQWFRLFSSMFLHATIVHLVCNAFVLGFAGWNLEKIVGSRWLLGIYFAGGIVGSFVSLWLGAINTISVGASGAIMGLLAALFVLTFRERTGTNRFNRQLYLLRLLIPALLPAAAGHHIDVNSHLGGAIGGGLMGLLVTRAWLISSRNRQ